MGDDLLAQFLRWEANSGVRALIERALENDSLERSTLELNLFDVVIDPQRAEVVLQDVTDATPDGEQTVGLQDFLAALARTPPV
jgi:hypothetical protein